MVAASKLKMTYAEYLAAEEASLEKHEFLDGEVYAMTGRTLEHSVLASALSAMLRGALGGRGCLVFESNARVRSPQAPFGCYPDVTVVCGGVQRAGDDPQAISNPTVVLEVLSESTEAHDRGEKSRQYRAIPSVQEIVLVEQGRRSVEVSRRSADGHFVLHEFTEGTVELTSIRASLSLDEVYADAEAIRVG